MAETLEDPDTVLLDRVALDGWEIAEDGGGWVVTDGETWVRASSSVHAEVLRAVLDAGEADRLSAGWRRGVAALLLVLLRWVNRSAPARA